MITGEYASAIDNRGEMSTHRPIEKSQMSHATNVQIGGTVNNYAAHSPGMPHTPGISYVNGVGYLDVGTGQLSFGFSVNEIRVFSFKELLKN